MLIYGSKEQSMPEIIPAGEWEFGGVTISWIQIVIFVNIARSDVFFDMVCEKHASG